MANTGKSELTPAAKAVMEEEGLSVDDVIAGLKRLTRQDVERAKSALSASIVPEQRAISRDEARVAMSDQCAGNPPPAAGDKRLRARK